ncbi:MAG: site-specific DNA-methyltransferase [Firmicutes bacterium]|nr:site-specific DNA-methyltransferase [Bacillota bacterium]
MSAESCRNHTIRLSEEEQALYLERCLRLPEKGALQSGDVLDRTILGNMLEILPRLPKHSADLAIVDPPYNRTKSYGDHTFNTRSAEDYRNYTIQWLDLLLPVLKPDASLYVCCDWQSSLLIGPVLAEKLVLRSRITWQREKGRGASRNWKNGLEDIWFATVGPEYHFHMDAVRERRRVIAPYRENGLPKDWYCEEDERFRDTCPSNFWDDITVPFWSMHENTDHPAQKPEKLLAKLILASSDPGATVLDPFLGSGTTSVVCRKLGRHYIGIEQEPLYCALTEKRLEAAASDDRIQGFEDGVFWERNTGFRRRKK